jgi:SH3 domain protein
MKLLPSALLVLSALLMTLSQAYADTRYVSDILVVTVRDQKGDNYKILESLTSSTPVEILDEDKTYVKVRTPKGTEGFIRKQYITKELPKAIQVKRLEKEVAELEQTLNTHRQSSQESRQSVDQQKRQIEELSEQLGQARRQLEQTSASYQELRDSSENVVLLTSENEQLIEQNNQMSAELEILREENRNFHRSNMLQWFLAGAGVFFGGWLIGKISRKKSSGFSRF